ncbi:YraN family protein [Gordonibacter sp. An230]|uniref:YraN family protein n=1 Tax=Gordonibacter sp. An230 TaxID=1965592 RepID=UPI001EF6A43C|nr:YraN family protein [Gordonibacter sp. An230]
MGRGSEAGVAEVRAAMPSRRGRKGGGTEGASDAARRAELGRRGEDAAARFLERRGYDIVERNWECAAGEADIVARDDDGSLVFVEVKTRSNCERGLPSEAVDAEKRERYERIAACFLADYDVVDVPVRFDIIGIVAVSEDRAMIRHHINAFCAV